MITFALFNRGATVAMTPQKRDTKIMGDRCYMTVRSRKQDAHIFEELGFQEDQTCTPEPGIVTMFDEQANYAHSGALPENVPWTGRSETGGAYGPCEYACDGSKLLEVSSGFDGGYVINWTNKGAPDPVHIAHVNAFLALEQKAEAMLKTIDESQ